MKESRILTLDAMNVKKYVIGMFFCPLGNPGEMSPHRVPAIRGRVSQMLKGHAQAKIIKKWVILFRLLNMTI